MDCHDRGSLELLCQCVFRQSRFALLFSIDYDDLADNLLCLSWSNYQSLNITNYQLLKLTCFLVGKDFRMFFNAIVGACLW